MPDRLTGGPSKSVEDFLKAVYTLQQRSERVSTNALKEALNISAPSVTDMARRLVDAELVDYRKYYGVRLTVEGEQLALRVLRRHRLIELYLVQELGYDLHEVHDEAEALEHAVSDQFVEAIAHKLNDPQFDPHGDPIPAADGSVTRRVLHPLSELELYTAARVSRFITTDPEMLQHTIDRGFVLDAVVEVIARDPFDGPLTIRLDGDELIIGYNLAASILVEMLPA